MVEDELATKPPENSAALQEIDDAVRAEQLSRFAKRFGPWIAGLVVGALLAGGAWLMWQNQQTKAREADGEAWAALSDKLVAAAPSAPGQPATVPDALAKEVAAFAASADRTPAYRAVAAIAQANQLVAAGDRPGAAAALAKLAGDVTLDKSLRDLALIRQTMLDFDAKPPATIAARMQPIADQRDPASPWAASATELAALAHYSAGEYDKAAALFARIPKVARVSDTLKSRAGQMAGMLGLDVVADPAADTSKNGATK